MKQFGKLPRKKFTPKKPTRGGGFSFEKTQEAPLTGKVQGMKAAQGEERLARTTDKGIGKGLVSKYVFRWTTAPRATQVYKELDQLTFLSNGKVIAISVKGTDFVHRNSAEKEQDKLNELIILAKLRGLGYNVAEITTVPADKLNTQKDADEVGRKLGIYR